MVQSPLAPLAAGCIVGGDIARGDKAAGGCCGGGAPRVRGDNAGGGAIDDCGGCCIGCCIGGTDTGIERAKLDRAGGGADRIAGGGDVAAIIGGGAERIIGGGEETGIGAERIGGGDTGAAAAPPREGIGGGGGIRPAPPPPPPPPLLPGIGGGAARPGCGGAGGGAPPPTGADKRCGESGGGGATGVRANVADRIGGGDMLPPPPLPRDGARPTVAKLPAGGAAARWPETPTRGGGAPRPRCVPPPPELPPMSCFAMSRFGPDLSLKTKKEKGVTKGVREQKRETRGGPRATEVFAYTVVALFSFFPFWI
jgi:hypothetical protein